jgi:hypothetical protein
MKIAKNEVALSIKPAAFRASVGAETFEPVNLSTQNL